MAVTIVAFLLGLLIVGAVQAADLTFMDHPLAPHPRLFASAARWDEIKSATATDEVSKQLRAVIAGQADRMLSDPPLKFEKKGRRLLSPIRESQGRILTFAMLAWLTGDEKYTNAALREMRALASLPDWNPSHFLDAAEATFAIGVGYDWLYDELSDQDRTLFEQAIVEKGLKPSFPSQGEQDDFWVRGGNNWNQVCHGGLVAGALAIAEREPELSRAIVERAIANLRFAAGAYAPDGAYPEGPMYWQYGTTFHVALVASLESALGSRFKLDEFPGFHASAQYIQQMMTPTGGVFNYSDNGPSRGFQAALFWFARDAGNRSTLAWELDRLRTMPSTDPKWGRGGMLFPLSLIWWNAALPPATSSPARLSWMGKGQVPVAVHRSAWGDRAARFVAIKGGKPSASHGHMDVGSFILEADGVRWAIDLGAQDYHSLESVGLQIWPSAQNSDRWKVFVLGANSHNIIRFNGAAQLVNGSSPIVRFRPDGPNPFTICDLTPAYANDVADARRGVSLRGDGRILIQDEWTARSDRPADASFQWMTNADVTIGDRSVALRQSGKQLVLRVVSTGGVTIEEHPASSLTKPYDQVDKKVRRIVIKTEVPVSSSGRLVIIAKPGSVMPADAFTPIPLAEW